MDLFTLARKAAFILAVVALAINLWRAITFVQPILIGARLLKADLVNRRRDLDGLYAHQTKRVDGLAADVERLTRASTEAERRLGHGTQQSGLIDPPPFEISAQTQAQNLFLALARALREGGPRPESVPQRIVLALDNLDTLPPESARQILDTLHRLTASSGIVSLVAVDPLRLGTSLADLERWIQVPLRLDGRSEERDPTALVLHALGHAAPPAMPVKLDASQSVFDAPVSEGEATLLAALAPIAGTSPRSVKRFVNLYRLARLDADVGHGALALMLALDGGGTQAERQVAEEAMRGDNSAAAFEPRPTSPRLRVALNAVQALDGRVSKADMATAAARAALFSIVASV